MSASARARLRAAAGVLATVLLAGAASAPQPLPLPPEGVPTAVPAPPVPPAPVPQVAGDDAASATEGEVARLSQLSQADAARRGAESSVRNAPGRQDVEVGGLRRCVDAVGESVFTDRRCDLLGAGDAPPDIAPPRVAPGRPISVRSCARSKADLLDGVRSALEGHDVNRVADYYDWAGMDGAEGYRLMDRLETFAKRPFVDAQLVSSAAARPMPDDDGSAGLLSRPFDPPGLPEPPVAPAPRPRPADLLRVDQMRSDRDAVAQVTYFRLRANAGCWWVAY